MASGDQCSWGGGNQCTRDRGRSAGKGGVRGREAEAVVDIVGQDGECAGCDDGEAGGTSARDSGDQSWGCGVHVAGGAKRVWGAAGGGLRERRGGDRGGGNPAGGESIPQHAGGEEAAGGISVSGSRGAVREYGGGAV